MILFFLLVSPHCSERHGSLQRKNHRLENEIKCFVGVIFRDVKLSDAHSTFKLSACDEANPLSPWLRGGAQEGWTLCDRQWRMARLVRGRGWPSVNCSSGVVTETPRSFPQAVAHNLKLATNIDHTRDGTVNAPSQPCLSPVVPEHWSGGLVRQRGLSV